MSRRTEIQVGATVLASLVILIGSLAWLKSFSLHASTRIWKVEFPEAGGLSPSDEVLVNGMRKGEVRSMKLEGARVRVELALDREITLTHDSQVAIRNVGMMGEKVIAVDLKATGTPYRTDEVIVGNYERGMAEVMSQLSGTVDAVSTIAERLVPLAEALSRPDGLTGTIGNFNRTSEELRLTVSENRSALHEVVENFAQASRTTKRLTTDREAELKQTLETFSSAAEKMDALTGRLDSLRAVIQTVTVRVERGEGTLGKLVNDDQLYADLNTSVQSLKSLIEDIKANPKKYLKISIF